MYKKRLLSILSYFTILTMLFASNVTSTTALSIEGMGKNQATYENLNLIILVKASYKSNDPINDFENNPKTRLKVIQDAVNSAIDIYQFPPYVNVGLMVYGHLFPRGTTKSCLEDNVEELIPIQPFSRNMDLVPFSTISGLGEAPTSIALIEAAKKFPQDSSNALNAILLIADGADSCGQDPKETGRLLAEKQKIVIYSIGLGGNNEASAELIALADSANGKYFSTDKYRTKSQIVTDDLRNLIVNVFDDLLSGISTPVPTEVLITPTTTIPTVSPTIAEVISTPTSPLSPATIEPTGAIPTEAANPTENWLSGGILAVSVLSLIVLAILVFLFWKSRFRATPIQLSKKSAENEKQPLDSQKIAQNMIKAERVDTSYNNDLDIFLQEIYKAYSTFGNGGRYIPLELLKKKLANKYLEGMFDEMLIQTRQKYPSKIWIDKDSQGHTIIKIVP